MGIKTRFWTGILLTTLAIATGTAVAKEPAQCPAPSWTLDLSKLGFQPFLARSKQLPLSGTFARGILFFSPKKLLVYQVVNVDRQKLVRREHDWNDGSFSLKLVVFDVEEKQVTATRTVSVEEGLLEVYPLADGRLLLRTENHLIILSEELKDIVSKTLPQVGNFIETWRIQVSNTGRTIFRQHLTKTAGPTKTVGNFLHPYTLAPGQDIDLTDKGVPTIGDPFLIGRSGFDPGFQLMDANGRWARVPLVMPEPRSDDCRGAIALVTDQFLFAASSCEKIDIGTLDGHLALQDTLDHNDFVDSWVSRGSIVGAQILKQRPDPFDTGDDRRPVAINVYALGPKSRICSIPTPKFVGHLYTVSETGDVAYIQDSFLNVVKTPR